ncbi:hypothetical protein M8494_22445 [Serratia ureilytica]
MGTEVQRVISATAHAAAARGAAGGQRREASQSGQNERVHYQSIVIYVLRYLRAAR